MPCSDGGWSEAQRRAGEAKKLQEARQESVRLSRELNLVNGILCAVMNEAERALGEKFDRFIQQASKSGEVDVKAWADKHRAMDLQRIKDQIQSTMSEDEINTLKKLIEDGEI